MRVSVTPAVIQFFYRWSKEVEVARLDRFSTHAESRRGGHALILRAAFEQPDRKTQIVDIGGYVLGVGAFEPFLHRRGGNEVEFHLPVSTAQLEAIDAGRTSSHRDVVLSVTFHASVIGVNGVLRHVVSCSWRVPESDWSRLLVDAGYGDALSFSFVLPSQIPVELETAAACFHEALLHWRHRDWTATVAAARKVLEALSKLPGAKPPPNAAEWATGQKASWSADDRAAFVRQGLMHVGNVAAHPTADAISEEHAELVLSQSMLMLRARLRATRP